MSLIKEVLETEKKYKITKEKADELFKSVREKSKNLRVKDFECFNFEELKETIENLYLFLPKEVKDEVTYLLEEKKIEKYPFLKKACYFPELNNIDFLSEEEILKLDKILKFPNTDKITKVRLNVSKIFEILDERENELKILEDIIRFLLDAEIIEKEYIIDCGMQSICNYDVVYIAESELSKYKRIWKLRKNTEAGICSEKEKKELEAYNEQNDADLIIQGYEERFIIKNQDEFDKCCIGHNYVFIKKPDYSIDSLF